jgi:hypothetical protein
MTTPVDPRQSNERLHALFEAVYRRDLRTIESLLRMVVLTSCFLFLG